MLYIRMLLIMAVSLYTSRVVLNTLGVSDFGTYNVVAGVVIMFGFFNGAMVSVTQRFLSFELGKKDFIQLGKIFNVTQAIHIGIAIFIFILAETIGLWFLNNYLNIPGTRMEAARWIFHLALLSFMINIIQIPYNSVLIARERMSVYSYISIIEVILKLAVVFMLTWIAYDKLKLYGILLFLVSIIIAAIYIIYTKRNFEEVGFQFVKDKSLYKTLIRYSSWNLFGSFAMVAKGQGINMMLNIFFGTTINAAQGISNQVLGAINSFVTNFQMASNPQIVKSYAANDTLFMTNLIIRTSKLSFYLLFVLTLPVLLEVDYILHLWLKIVPAYTVIFTTLILVNAWLESFSGPLVTAINATGKIKAYQVVIGLTLMLNLPLSYLFFKLGYSPVATFLISILMTSVAFLVRLIYIRKLIPSFSVKLFLNKAVIRNIPVILLSAIVPFLIKMNFERSFERLLLVMASSTVSAVTIIYIIGLSKNERHFLTGLLMNFKQKFSS